MHGGGSPRRRTMSVLCRAWFGWGTWLAVWGGIKRTSGHLYTIEITGSVETNRALSKTDLVHQISGPCGFTAFGTEPVRFVDLGLHRLRLPRSSPEIICLPSRRPHASRIRHIRPLPFRPGIKFSLSASSPIPTIFHLMFAFLSSPAQLTCPS